MAAVWREWSGVIEVHGELVRICAATTNIPPLCLTFRAPSRLSIEQQYCTDNTTTTTVTMNGKQNAENASFRRVSLLRDQGIPRRPDSEDGLQCHRRALTAREQRSAILEVITAALKVLEEELPAREVEERESSGEKASKSPGAQQ